MINHSTRSNIQFFLTVVSITLLVSACASQPSLGRAKSLWRRDEPAALDEARRVARLNNGKKSIEAAKLATEISLQTQPLSEVAKDYEQYLTTAKQHNWPLLERYCLTLVSSARNAWTDAEKLAALQVIAKVASPSAVERILKRSLSSDSHTIRDFAQKRFLQQKSLSKTPLFEHLNSSLDQRKHIEIQELELVLELSLQSYETLSTIESAKLTNLALNYLKRTKTGDSLLRCRAAALIQSTNSAFRTDQYLSPLELKLFKPNTAKVFDQNLGWNEICALFIKDQSVFEELRRPITLSVAVDQESRSIDKVFIGVLQHADLQQIAQLFRKLETQAVPIKRQNQIFDVLAQRITAELPPELQRSLSLILTPDQSRGLSELARLQNCSPEDCKKLIAQDSDPVIQRAAIKRLADIQANDLKFWYELACRNTNHREFIFDRLSERLRPEQLELWLDDSILNHEAARVLAKSDQYMFKQLRRFRIMPNHKLARQKSCHRLLRQALSQGALFASDNSRAVIAEIALDHSRPEQSIERIHAAGSLLLLARKRKRSANQAIILR